MAHRFPFARRHVLDAPERLAGQPPGPLLELIAKAPRGPVLDLGAGTGYLALPMARSFPERAVVALDSSPAMAAVLAARARPAPVRCLVAEAGGTPLPLRDGTFACVVAVNLIHELDHRAAVLAELERVLVPEGLLVLCDWSPAGTPQAGPPIAHRLEAASVVDDLRALGWTRIERPAPYTDHWVLTARRPASARQPR